MRKFALVSWPLIALKETCLPKRPPCGADIPGAGRTGGGLYGIHERAASERRRP
jgi:hypothetical protein